MPLPHGHYYLTRDNIPRFLYVNDIVDTNKKNYETIAILKAIGLGKWTTVVQGIEAIRNRKKLI